MSKIFFNSRSELDKLPFGAVKAGCRVKFGLRADSELALTKVLLITVCEADGITNENPLELVWTEKGFSRFEGEACFESTGLFGYYFKAVSDDVEMFIEKSEGGAELCEGSPRSWQQTVYDTDYTTPEWIMGGAFYHIFVDRFCKAGNHPVCDGGILRSDWGAAPVYKPNAEGEITNSDFFGGDLDGVIEKLPYLKSLGISCIYLSPIFEAASNHKYDTADYMKIDPAFGDETIFSRLCEEAKALEIRVICDGVFNHTGDKSVYFNRNGKYGTGGAYRDKASPYYSWYSFSNWPNEYAAWWGIKTLPQLCETNEGLRRFIFGENGVLKKWMRAGAFGWRLDVADELPETFLRELRETVKLENPEALIIGEVWEDASNKISYGERRHYFEGAELDSVMNYPFKDAIIDYMRTRSSAFLCETVESICENYPKPALDCLMNVLGTHDTARILTVLGGKSYSTRDERAAASLPPDERENAKSLLRLAAVLQCTLPGVPCIYYGDEVGLEGYEDPFNRRCYPWENEDKELLSWYTKVLNARRSCPAFAGGEYKTLSAENGAFSFMRKKANTRVLIVINLGTEAVQVKIETADRIIIQENVTIHNAEATINSFGCAVIELA
ncbi:MAG: glycoside hydrolase family 13 protein [Oscillospiraceae bacterium]